MTGLTVDQLTSYPLRQIAKAYGLDESDVYAFAHVVAVNKGILPGPAPAQIVARCHVIEAMNIPGGHAELTALVEAAVHQRVVGY